jgi:putative membrane protein
MRLTPAERDAVSAAVSAAEAGTDGEIVTMIAPVSDAYRDVPPQYGLLAALLVPALVAIDPARLPLISDGWSAPELWLVIFAVMLLQVIAFLIVRYALARTAWRLRLTPRATKRRRVRARAVELFRVAAEQRTAKRVGVLLYLSTGERMAEIVADAAIHAKVPPERWGDAMAALVEEVRQGRPGAGMVAAVGAIGSIIAEHFPKTDADTNELPDRLIEL